MSENTKVIAEGFERVDGKLVWRETRQSNLSDTGCIYICQDPNRQEGTTGLHMLVKIPKGDDPCNEPDQFFWTTLWNVCGITGKEQERRKWQHVWESIEDAIQAKIDCGWIVIRTTFHRMFRHMSDDNIDKLPRLP